MFLCGDDAAAKRTVAGLVEARGFDPVDCGPLARARLLGALEAAAARPPPGRPCYPPRDPKPSAGAAP
jgi:hypothetical protein